VDLNQVTVPATDVAASVAFYRALGLRLIVDSVPRYARFECPDGDSTFSVHRVEQVPDTVGLTVYFECRDLDTTVTRLQAEGLEFDSGPEDQRWLWREARLRDPAGNEICLYTAGENRRSPPWRIDGKRPAVDGPVECAPGPPAEHAPGPGIGRATGNLE
jgi:catechol 2,3-dioxygenase-like lactoylglutathione lyase family enzyme